MGQKYPLGLPFARYAFHSFGLSTVQGVLKLENILKSKMQIALSLPVLVT
jgi:hypothetical protein